MFNVLLILFFTTATSSLKSMEIAAGKKEKKIIKSASFPFSGKTSTKNFNVTITPIVTQSEHPFVIATESNNIAIIENYLNNFYFNPNVHRYKTAFHACVESKNYPLLLLFLKEPRIDTSLKNRDGQTGHDILKQQKLKETNSELKNQMYEWLIKLFARNTLDITTNEICAGLKQSYLQGSITNTIIIDVIAIIEKKIDKIRQNQIVSKKEKEYVEDRQLPEAACFPEYATNEFMTKKIWFILDSFDTEFIRDTKNL